MAHFDLTQINAPVDRLLNATQNPLHRYLLTAYKRHRLLELSGRYEEVFASEMTVENPVYRFNLIGQSFKLEGRDALESLYRYWAETDQSIFYGENETVAVGDTMVVSRVILYQQQLGSALRERGIDAEENAMYLMKANIAMIWPYDNNGRMVGEDVWEYDDTDRDFVKLNPADVLTTEQAAKLLDPFIEPLPPFPSK